MLINIGNLAQTYNVLPSYILEHATTFDLMVADVMMAWENQQKNPTDLRNYRMDDLQNIMESVR